MIVFSLLIWLFVFFLMIVPGSLIISGLIVLFFTRSRPNIGWGKRILLTLLITSVISVGVISFCVVDHINCTKDFWRCEGQFDYYRMPLLYPFQLEWTDTLEWASLSQWRHSDSSCDICHISEIYMGNQIIAGQYDKGYFIADSKTLQVSTYPEKTEFTQALKNKGLIDEPQMIPLQDMWDEYLKNKSAWKKKYEVANTP